MTTKDANENSLAPASNASVSRRKFISGSFILATSASCSGVFSVSAAENALSGPAIDVPAVTRLVTGKNIDDALASRAIRLLIEQDNTFHTSLTALSAFITDNKVTSIDTLKTLPGFSGDIRTAAQKIISAIYLGYIGTPKAHAAHDNVKFVSYTQAQVYSLTKEYTPIPSYSRWQSGYWEFLPETK